MMKKFLFILTVLCFTVATTAQQENVPLDHDVYSFLKEMKVKEIIADVHDDSPNMSRAEVKALLATIKQRGSELSETENNLLNKYSNEFCDEGANSANTFQLFGNSDDFSNDPGDIISDKIKYSYVFKNEFVNFYFNILGRGQYGQQFNPVTNNAELYDIGIKARGTLFQKLGYSMSIQKGGVTGPKDLAIEMDSRMKYNFKFLENIENLRNYDFTESHLRYYIEPARDMALTLQIGREKLKFGYGYGSKLILSGDHPMLDFIKLDFSYGIINFTSIHGTTVGEFNEDRTENYTKFFALNRLKFQLEGLFDFGIGENIIYSGRGLDLAYLNPFAFYKYEEMSLQDRDNGAIWLDLQTRCIKNLEVQATLFFDDNPMSHLQNLDNFINKTGYQLGAFWYSPFSISDLSLIFEYTRIRPYVYSHITEKNTYTSWGQLLGHRIGPNSDEICLKAAYNINAKMRLGLDYQYARHGNNIYDEYGYLVFNAGGDPFVTHRYIDPVDIKFLAGERVNTNIFSISLRYEPIRMLFFDFIYRNLKRENISKGEESNLSFGYIKMFFEI
jgi:hypothetical protein